MPRKKKSYNPVLFYLLHHVEMLAERKELNFKILSGQVFILKMLFHLFGDYEAINHYIG